jgi:hypothetical protein
MNGEDSRFDKHTRHWLVQRWLDGGMDAGGTIAALERELDFMNRQCDLLLALAQKEAASSAASAGDKNLRWCGCPPLKCERRDDYMRGGEVMCHYPTEGSRPSASSSAEGAIDALGWILPMAKGYAAEHPVGRNQEIVDHAEAVLLNTAAPLEPNQHQSRVGPAEAGAAVSHVEQIEELQRAVPPEEWDKLPLAHTDHPARHYDRTCPACNAAPQGVEGTPGIGDYGHTGSGPAVAASSHERTSEREIAARICEANADGSIGAEWDRACKSCAHQIRNGTWRESVSAIRTPDRSWRCAKEGHFWVGTGDERVVCEDCGIEKGKSE